MTPEVLRGLRYLDAEVEARYQVALSMGREFAKAPDALTGKAALFAYVRLAAWIGEAHRPLTDEDSEALKAIVATAVTLSLVE